MGTKAILTVGYVGYVMELKDAVAVAEAFARAELYEHKYLAGGEYSHHIYPNMTAEVGTIKLISEDLYRMAKLAGEPEK